MNLVALVALVPMVACTAASPTVHRSVTNSQAAPIAPVAPPSRPAPPADDLAALRAEGPAALDRLLVQYDGLPEGAARTALAARIDKVAAQRYATVSRLYWYTDLAAAQAAARATGKPILSLRMLGRLDEELSCANSRMFRTILYPDAAVSALLRDRFVLHWSSERPVPTVTVDYGDGRTLATTVTGNSAHYVLDADGHVLDVLPGLYAPSVFRRELVAAADLAASLRGQAPDQQRARLAGFHRDAEGRLATAWQGIRALTILDGDPHAPSQQQVDNALASAQRATMSKMYIEVPLLQRLDLGANPGVLPADLAVRAVAAARLFDLEPMYVAPSRMAPHAPARGGLLDERARALVTSMLPADDDDARQRALVTLDQTIAGDTLLDETALRPVIRGFLIDAYQRGELPDFAPVNTFVYATVFQTPASDPWLGLRAADTFTGLPGGAIVGTR